MKYRKTSFSKLQSKQNDNSTKNWGKLYNKSSLILQYSCSNITGQLLQDSSGARAKIWSNFTTRLAYLLQHSHSLTSVELESQNLVKLYSRQSLYATAQPIPDFSKAREPTFCQIIHKTSLLTTAQPLTDFSRAREPNFGQIIQD